MLEVLYGGAAGGGKSDALLMAALRYVDVPGYSALLLRKTFADLSKPGALMDRAAQWLGSTNATWHERTKTWTFPSGAKLTFGYLETANDHYQYQGAEYQFVGFDELTQFPENQYRYLFSRTRRLKGSTIPVRVRAGSNPGGMGHQWVYQRFLRKQSQQRAFIPAKLDDNPHLDRAEYERSLSELGAVEREQLRNGNWLARADGVFRRSWFRYWQPEQDLWRLGEKLVKPTTTRRFGIVDLAFSLKKSADFTTLGAYAVTQDSDLVLLDLQKERLEAPDLIPAMRRILQRYKLDYLCVEANGPQMAMVQMAQRAGLTVRALKAETDKLTRSTTAQIRLEAGQIWFPANAPWLDDFEQELCGFPAVEHDDQVDNLSYGALEVFKFGAAPETQEQAKARQAEEARQRAAAYHDLDNDRWWSS